MGYNQKNSLELNKIKRFHRLIRIMIRCSFAVYFASFCFLAVGMIVRGERGIHIFNLLALILFLLGAVFSGIANLMNLLSETGHQDPPLDEAALSQLEKQLEICYHNNEKNDQKEEDYT